MATTFWPTAEHWSCEIPLDTPHPRLDVLAERGFVQLRDLPFAGSRARVPRPRVHGLEERRRHQLRADRDRRRSARLPRLLEQGRRAPRQGCTVHGERRHVPDTRATRSKEVGADFGRVRTIKLEPQDHDTAFRSFHRDDNNRFNPPDQGWVVRSWIELTDFPESYMLLMDTGPDGLPDPATEVRLATAPRRTLRARHAAPVARRRAQRQRAALRADLQLRERTRARRVGAVATPVAQFASGERRRQRGVEALRRPRPSGSDRRRSSRSTHRVGAPFSQRADHVPHRDRIDVTPDDVQRRGMRLDRARPAAARVPAAPRCSG